MDKSHLDQLIQRRHELIEELQQLDCVIDSVQKFIESQCAHQWERDVTVAHDDLIKWACAKCEARK